MHDTVNHPRHYTNHPSGVECIEITEWLGFALGNAFKYLFRRGHKGKLNEDLEKALWYLKRERAREKAWVEEAPEEVVESLRAKVTRIVGYEPTFIGAAMSHILEAYYGPDTFADLDKAILYVGREIERVRE
jgi:hypothetical protein